MTRSAARAVRAMPPGYEPRSTIDFTRSPLRSTLTIANLALLLPLAALFLVYAQAVRGDVGAIPSRLGVLGLGVYVVAFVPLVALAAALHEAIHGLCFWLSTRHRPEFGLVGSFAYTTTGGWYVPRDEHLAAALAPLVVITLGTLALLPRVPLAVLPALLVVFVVNAAGAVGDVVAAAWLLAQPRSALVRDTGYELTAYAPSGQSS